MINDYVECMMSSYYFVYLSLLRQPITTLPYTLVPHATLFRSETRGQTGPLMITLRDLERLLGMPLPDEIRDAAARWQPAVAKRALFDALLLRALLPDHPSCNDGLAGTARWLLYVRAHYLRMP